MSLDNYFKLQAHSCDEADLLGAVLPKLITASLSVKSQTLSAEQTISEIADFAAEQGWLMLRDGIELCLSAPERRDFIEGEWCRGDRSLKIKLIGHDQYLVTEFAPSEATQVTQAYSEQQIYLRNELKEQTDCNTACYRFWWQQEQSSEHRGRWVPLVQQFIGFDHTKEAR
ncbi:hypothetical protein ABT56_22135 [Photobacterium aquae]|uniref:Uncharacterized protein n=1 Tax=Photobacterium aquae TaxID=1195763 RepID=A0A0J1GPV2_9GAMM|nr:hypothetical protein [Photobacterium aquae]KLV01459.1 hypothetical protein ABT56_22135 [Photobacterium aquae]